MEAEKGRGGKLRRPGRQSAKKMIEGSTQEKGVGEEMWRWGSDESSWYRQSLWGGLLWGRRHDTCSHTHTIPKGSWPSRRFHVSSCCGGGWKTAQGRHWDAEFTVEHLYSPPPTHTHSYDNRARGLIKSEDGWTEEHGQWSCGRQQGWEHFLHGFPLRLSHALHFFF